MSNKTETTIEFVEGTLENALEEMKNRRTYLKKVMKPAEDAAKDLEKATATEKVRLQGTKEPKVPNLKPYTEALDVKDRKELGRLISGAKADGRPWTVKRCSEEKLQEGYRYTFFTNKVGEVFTESLHTNDLVLDEAKEEEVPADETVEITAEEPVVDLSVEEPVIEVESEIIPEEDEAHKAISILKNKLNLHPGKEEGTFVICLMDEEGKEKECIELKDVTNEELTTLNAVFFEPKEFAKEQEEEAPVEETPAEEVVDLELETETPVEESIDKDSLKAERDTLWAKMPDCTKEEIQRLIDIRTELGDEEFYNECITKEALEEASSAEKRAYKNGGQDLKDLDFGKALARVKDPHERAMLLHQHKLEQSGKFMSDRASTEDTLARKLAQAEVATDKKMNAMHDAGYALDEEVPLDEGVKISLDDLTLFKPWGGAKDVWELIIAQEKLEALDKALEDMYPEGITATDLNDILWFEKDWIFDTIDLKPFVPKEDAIEADAVVVKDVEETPVEEN